MTPSSRVAGRVTGELTENSSQLTEFNLRGLDVGIHQGWIEIVGDDGLAVDNTRWFTVEVREAWPVLVVAGPGANPRFLAEALAPLEFRETGQARFNCDVISAGELSGRQLDDYASICLLDPPPLTTNLWQALADYTDAGGSLAVFLGRNARPIDQFNNEVALKLLPGKLTRQWRSGGSDLYLAPRGGEHAILSKFQSIGTTIPWHAFPISKHWSLSNIPNDVQTVIRFGNNKPALLQRTVGKGTVLTMTTPISDPANIRGRDPWNWLPTGFEPWPFVMLSNETVNYLVASGESRMNYLAGRIGAVANSASAESRGRCFAQPIPAFYTVRRLGGSSKPATVNCRLGLPKCQALIG